MRKLTFSFKSLLVAAGLCVGASAWAQTTAFSQDFTAVGDPASTDPSDYGFTLTYGSGSSSTLVNFSVENGILKCVAGPYAQINDGARTGTATTTFDAIGSGNEVNVTFKWALGAATGNASGSYTKTRIGNSSGAALELGFYGNNGSLRVNGTEVKANTDIRNTTYTVSATLNMNTQKITALTMTCSNTTYSYSISEPIDFASAITSVDRFAFENSERQNWSNTSSVDDVSITYSEARESVESFVLNYTYGGNIIESENIGVAGLYCGDTYESLPFRMYILKDGVLYKTTANSSDYYHEKNITLVKNTVVSKSLSVVDLKGGTVVFFRDFDGSTSNNADIRASYGSSYENTQFTSEEDLPAGKYTFMVKAYSRGRGSVVKVGDTQIFTIADVGNSWTDKTYENVEVPEAGKLALVKGASSTDPVDILIAIFMPKTISVSITAAGYATFNSDYALDLDNISGGTAYIVKSGSVSGNAVSLTAQAGKVAANTGLILKTTGGADGTITIPVVATGDDISATNKLIAVTTNDTDVSADAYILGCEDDYTNVGLYKLDAANTLDKGQAYLPANFSNVKALRFVIDDTATGVDAVPVAEAAEEDGVLYNTAGQVVSKDYKGIVIKNGKKFLNK